MVVYAVAVYAWLCTHVTISGRCFCRALAELRARLPLSRWRAVHTDDCMGDCMGDSRAVRGAVCIGDGRAVCRVVCRAVCRAVIEPSYSRRRAVVEPS